MGEGSKLYLKACPICRGDVLYRAAPERELFCIQGGHRFDSRRKLGAEIDGVPPDGATSRKYVEDQLSGLQPGYAREVAHVEWLTCRGAKEGCTLASAIRQFRHRHPDRFYIQVHDERAIWVRRVV